MRGWVKVSLTSLLIFTLFAILILVSSARAPLQEIEYELLSNTDYCLVDCSLIFKFKINNDYTVNTENDFRRVFEKVSGDVNILEHGFRKGETEKYNVDVWVPNIICDPYTVTVNGTTEIENCTDMGHYEAEERERFVYNDYNPVGKTIKAGEWHYIEFWASKELKLGNDAVDAIPILGGFEFPFAIWDSYPYRYEIESNATGVYVINVNDTYAPDLWTLNAAGGETKYLYCAVSGCTDGNWTVGNSTDETANENGDSGTGYNPTDVWESSLEGVYHMNETGKLYDSTSLSRHSAVPVGTLSSHDGMFGNSAWFDGSEDYAEIDGIYDTTVTSGSISFWMNTTVTGTDEFPIGYWKNGNDYWYVYMQADDNFRWYGKKGGQGRYICYHDKNSVDVRDGVWHHVVVRWNGSSCEFYTDGLNVTTGQFNYENGGFGGADANTRIGGYNDGFAYSYTGTLDEVRFYNRTLSFAEIQEQYYNGINNLTSLGDAESTGIANEANGNTAIVQGIRQSVLGTGADIYTDQQIAIRYSNGTQILVSFDKVALSGNQTWAFNYITDGESWSGMSNLSTTVYIWERESLTTVQIRAEVESAINSTKI